MNNYIVYPLLILVIIGSFNYLYLYDSVDFSSSEEYTQNLNASQELNETQTDLSIEQTGYNFEFTMTTGLVAIIIVVIVISALGASIVGSYIFGDRGLKMFYNGIVYYGLWGIFSAFSYSLIVSIPFFGLLLWFLLTFFYSLGVFNKMGS